MRHIRYFSLTRQLLGKSFKLDPNYKLKCGLEIHTQLNTQYKLFSLSPTTTTLNDSPNTKISYFDASLPGTQPILNPELILYTLKLLIVLHSQVNCASTFDRKHYFYGDQPMGYQITQHYNPIAKGGALKLERKFDDIDELSKEIRFEQLQIEQDTGRSIYKNKGITEIDLNRTNMPLIEIVTKPDFENLKQIKSFIKKFQLILKNLKICTGDLETGAMRIDVNLNVNDEERIELKNLPNTSSIINAVKYEYMRQVEVVKSGGKITRETRGWDGEKTLILRNKEDTTDYRYMPDPELPPINLDLQDMIPKVTSLIGELPNNILNKLMSEPYNCKLRDAMILLQDESLMNYYLLLFEILKAQKVDTRLAINWCCHELQGSLTKLNLQFTEDVMPVLKLSELIELVYNKKISNNNAKMLLLHLLNNQQDISKPLKLLIDEFDIGLAQIDQSQIDLVVEQVITENEAIVLLIQKGEKLNSINFLLGQCMKLSGGKIDNKLLLSNLKDKILKN